MQSVNVNLPAIRVLEKAKKNILIKKINLIFVDLL